MSRRKLVYANAELLASIFFPSRPGDWHRTDAGLPDGAKMTGCGYDFLCHRFWFAYEHPSFPEVPEGHMADAFDGVQVSAVHIDPATGCDEKMAAVLTGLVKEQAAREESGGLRHPLYPWLFTSNAVPVSVPHFEAKNWNHVKMATLQKFDVKFPPLEQREADRQPLDPDAPHIAKGGE